MELECDLSKINNEELLRKMWQQSEDAGRKKEIRSQLYKLRESRLRDLYQGDIMADNSVAGFGKDPLATSHGDALADQSFQSLKSKEIRDSLSPTEMKFQSMTLNNPNTSGWNVQSSKEVSPDGRGFRAETVATTDGVESVNGGIAEFKGRNEQRSSAHHQGDDKNFVKKAMESSNSLLQEKVVTGDENSGRTEVRTSSSKSTSSSQVFQSSSNVEYDDGVPQPQRYLMDANRPHAHPQDLQQRQQLEQQRLLEEQRIYEQQFQQQRQQHLNQQERRTSEQLSTTRQNINTEQKNSSQNVQTQETLEQNKRYVDMDKASPEYQQHVQNLMQQPGEIISNTVEYPKPNVKMITTVKRLPDGTIVRNKRYETEETTPTTPSTRTTSTAPNQTQPRRDSQQPITRNYQPDSAPHSRPTQDMVDSSNTSRYVQDTHTDDVETKFSSIKKSSSKFSTESTSETTQEFDDRHPHGVKPVTNDFSTHGFPSVRSNKPTQEYPGERPHAARPTQGFPSQGGPSRPSEAVVPHYTDATDNISERRVPTKDGEVIIVSSEKKRNYKTSSNSERIVETEQVIRDDKSYQQIPDKSGFLSVREPNSQQPKNYPSERQMQPHEQDFPLDKLPPGARIIKTTHSPHGDDSVVVVSSQKSHTAKHSSNIERVIEHDITRDDQPSGYPRIQPYTDNSPYNYTVTTPGEQMPQGEFPGTQRKPNADYSTQGFPSVRTPGHATPGDREPYGDYPTGTSKPSSNDYTTQGFPSVKPTSRPAAGLPSTHNQHPGSSRKSPSQDYSTQGFPSVRSPSKGTPTQGYPSNVDAGRPNGTAEQPRGTHTTTTITTKTQPRTPSPNKYKAPNTTVRETTERVIRKEKEVDSAHRAFAASLRSSSPIDHVRRDSYTTDSHTRHTPRSSISSTKTFRRDVREGSHDSAPSETSRVSTTTVTRNTPPRTVGGRTVVTKVVTTKNGPGANDTLNVTSTRSTKSPSPGKTVTTTTTTTRTLTSKDVPKATDNQPTRITTNNIDTLLFPINEPPPLTAITKLKFSDNHKQPHKKTKTNINKKNMLVTNPKKNPTASAVLEEVIEEPCIKKKYYLLGPSDQQSKYINTPQSLKSPQIYEKSPTKKPQPQPAPSSRSSKPSYNSRKPPTSVMTDDYDDADKLNTTSPLSPSSRSRTPQKIAPNDNDNNDPKPQDDWQTRPQPDNDERRTVNTETTFEKTETEKAPRRPNYEQPNVEWVLVDDVDDYDDDDKDSFAPEVVDSKLNIRKTTTKLITQEKQTPVAPQRRPKSTTTTTVTTKQFHTIPSKTQSKPSDRSPLKTKPNDSKTPQQLRPQKPLTDSRSPVRTPLKSQTKIVDNKQQPKAPKSTAPSYTSPLRKPLPKSTTEETTLRKTQKTTIQVVKDKTNKLIESEKLKRKPQSPERRTKPQTPIYKKPNGVEQQETEIVVTEVTQKRLPHKLLDRDNEPIYSTPYETADEPIQGRPSYRKPQDNDDEQTPGYRQPLDNDHQPIEGRPSYKSPQAKDDEHRPGYTGPHDTEEEPNKGSPDYRKPYGTDDEPNQCISGYRKPQETGDEPNQESPVYRKPQDPIDEPHKSSPVFKKPVSPGFRKLQNTFDETSPDYRKPQGEPHYSTPGYTKSQDNDEEPKNIMPGYEKPQKLVEQHITITETSQQRYPEREAPKRPDTKPNQQRPDFYKPRDTYDEYNQGPSPYKTPQDIDYEAGNRKPLDSDFEPRQNAPGYRQPHDTEEPHKRSPVYKQPLYTGNEKYPSTPGFKKLTTTDDETNEGLPHNRNPQQVSEHKIIITEKTQFSDKQNPQSPYYKPYDISEEPNQGQPRTPAHIKPVETEEEPGTPSYRKQPQTKPCIKPTATDDDECFTETESIITTSHKNVAKHIQKFESNYMSDKSSKPQKRTKSPTKELPQTQKKSPKPPTKDTSPTRTQKKPDETFVETNEFVINSTQKRIVDEKQILVEEPKKPGQRAPTPNQKKPGQKYPEEPTDKYPKSPKTSVSPTRPQKKPVDDKTFQTTLRTKQFVTEKTTKQLDIEFPKDTQPLKKGIKPLDTDDDETIVETREFVINSTQKRVVNEKQTLEFEDRGISPTRNIKNPEEPTGKRPQSPNKHVSPTRLQKKPEQKSPLKPTDGRSKSPNKHVSPTRTQKKRNEKTPLDNETYATTLKTTRIVRDKITQELEDEDKPKDRKPVTGKPLDSDDDETVTETTEFIINSKQKRVVSEKHMSVFEEPSHPDKRTPKKIPDTKTPTPKELPEQPTGRSQSPFKPVSPSRTQKALKPQQTLPVDDQTFRKTLRTTEAVTEKLTKKVDGKNYPVEKTPTKKDDRPEKKPKGGKPYSEQPSDTDEDEIVTETCEFVTNTTQKRIVTEQEILEFEEPRCPNNVTPKSKSPIRGHSPTPQQRQPDEKHPDDRLKEPIDRRPQSPNKPIVIKGNEKKPGLKEPTGKRPQSPTKHVSPTRTQRKPADDDETFQTSLRTTKTVSEKTTKKVNEEEYPVKQTPYKKGDKPGTKERKPSDTDEDETVTETSERFVSSKTCMVFEEPESPTRGVSPTRVSKKPGQKLPGQPDLKEPTDKRPKSPTRSQQKPAAEEPKGKRAQSPKKTTNEGETYKTTLRTTKTPTDQTTKQVTAEEYPDKRTPQRTGDKPDTKPKERKPHSGKPFDTDEEETFTSQHVISSKTHLVSEKLVQEFEEPESPTRGVSPTRSQKKPGQKQPEEPDFKKPIGKRPQSPTRTPNTPTDEEEIFKTTSRITKRLTEKTTEKYPDNTTPYRKGETPESKPKQRKPYSDKPCDTDEDETFTETSAHFISSKTHMVTEKLTQEVEEPESAKRPVSPKRTPKKLEQQPGLKETTVKRPLSPKRTHKKPTNEEETLQSALRTTKTVIEKTTKKLEDEECPDKISPYKTSDKPESKPKEHKPYSHKPLDTDKDETLTETSERFISSKTHMVTKQITDEFEEPEFPIRGVSPTRTPKKPGQQQSEEPDRKEPNGKRPLSPTRTQNKPTNEDETFKATLRTTKIVTTKVVDEEYPDERSPETKPQQRKPYSDKSYDTEDDETRTETSERFISSKTCKVTEKTKQEFDQPKSPTRAISPKDTQQKPKQNLPKEFGLKEPTDKRPQSATRATKIVSKTTEIEEFLEHEKPDKNPRKPGFVEPTEKRPKSPNKHVSPTRNQVVFEDDQTYSKTYKPTETDGDETFTTEIIMKTTQKPKYPGSQEPLKENPEKQPKYKRPGFEDIENQEIFTHTSEFIRNTAQKLITTEKQTIETEKERFRPNDKSPMRPKGSSPTKERSPTRSPSPKQSTVSVPTKTPRSPKDRKDSPTRSPSPKSPKNGPKSVSVDNETFRKTLKTTEKLTDKTMPKERKPGQLKPTVTDDEETTTETEDFVIETYEKRYVTDKNITTEEESTILVTPKSQKPNEKKTPEKEPLKKPKSQVPSENKPDTGKPVNKPFTTTYLETVETIEGQTYPKDTEQFPVASKFPDNQKPYTAPLEPWLPKQVSRDTTNINEQFMETERVRKETPDGAFISKTTEPTSPTSPTYKKKGAGRSDTFEERCRQILGMETYGDTPGTFKKQPSTEIEERKTVVTKDIKTTQEEDLNTTVVFQVKIEDCDEDDEPLSISSVQKTLHKQIHTKEPLREEPKEPKTTRKPVDEPRKKNTTPSKEEPQFVGPKDKSKHHEDYTDVTKTNKPSTIPKRPEDDENKFMHTVTKTTTINKKSHKTKSDDETQPDLSETETIEEHCVVVNKEIKKSEVKISKKSSPSSTPRAVSPTKSTTSSRSVSPTKPKSSPRNVSPLKETPKRKPSKDSLEPKTNKTSPQKPDNENTTTIKERLRSSTRKTKSPLKPDQVDGSGSSPEHSPTRYTDRRRSSNISVTTEIIIEHTDSDTPNKKEKSPVPVAKKPQDSVFREIIDSTVLPEKLTRRMLVTERKESAPVHRVTNRDKDSKMSRSTSENLIKVKKPEPQSLSPKSTPKTTDHRRPNKCFATKSINLSATDRLVNSEDMENIIIDIQHAKSSREPSPDKIVPTPVPAHVDTGKPRYPDVVQEPEDDQPRRKPQVKNIPIFEEENNAYVGCHITEVNMERTHKTTYDSLDYEEQILNNPVVEAPPSLDYPSLEKPTYDESLLTVHEKVSKFQNIVEEVNKPKASEPFKRVFDDSYKVPEMDECLLNINEKVDTFVKTSTLKTNEEDDEDEEFARNERIYTAIKLAPSAPQKSPELVRTISRHISRQNEPDSNDEQQPGYYNNEPNNDYPLTRRNDDFVECLVDNKKITKEFDVSHHHRQHTLQQQPTIKTDEKYQQPKQHDDDHVDDELIPHTTTHTNIIEERRQIDILSRPSVFDARNKKPTTKTSLQCSKSPVKDSEKLRPDIKSRTKPTSAVTNTATEMTTATTTTTANKHKQSPQRKNSDIDYELRGSGVETGVKNIISKQTKVYNSSNNNSSSTKTNDLKKSTTSNKQKPEKHMPVRLIPAKNSDENYLSADDDIDNEMIITVQAETTDSYDIETQVINEDLNKETTRKVPSTTPHKHQPTTTHSSTNSSPTDQPLKIKTKEHVVTLTDSRPLKSNTVTTTTSIKTYETDERADDIDEIVLVEPASKKKTSPHPAKPTKMSTSTTSTDSVAARRSLFESNNSSPSTTPTKRTPMTSPLSGRRPSYMDHTKSSLEHTRRDSLEINKTNYSRKPSHPEEEVPGFDRNSMVKFDVPQGKRATTPRATSVTEDINVEEIFELEVLERLLETVQSYEIRRRIRAQIRLIKKNQKNELITSSTEVITKTIKTTKVGSEEPDTVITTTTTRKTKPETKTTTQSVTKDAASHISSSKKEYIFEEAYMPTSRRSPKPNRYPYEVEKQQENKPARSQSPQAPVCRRNAEHERQYERSHHSPEHQHHTEVVREHASRTTKQQYYYKDEHEQEHVEEIRHETSPSRKSPLYSIHSSPERRNASPESHKPLRTNERSRSPQTKAPQSTRVTSSRSPDSKTSAVRKSSATSTYEQQETLKTSSSTKPQTKRITTTTTTTTTKAKPEDKTPVWADRKNILKTPSSTTPTKPSSSTLDSRAGYTKTIKSATTQKLTSHKSSFVDDDCVTSSYGIGPTDENGLPLFGIRALKKKKPTVEPSETTEEVTGYVVEEKYYSDSKTKPKVERKEFIYSTNPEELQKLKEQVEVTTNRKALKDVDVKETRQTALISKTTPALRSSPEDDFLDSSTKYVRRGSVKEMSEKFIQREASTAVTDKSNNYPKAGLILRTNSRKNSRDADNDNENFESYKTTRVQHHTSTVLADSDDNEHEYEVEEVGSRHSGRFITESESECDSIKTQREFKKVTSSSSSSMATRSFLNSQGEEKVITNVSDCLERMRNADNVVEEGDTAEDQEARALLNKFLGASIIMKGVESSLPDASNRQSKIITTTTTSSNLSDDNDGDNNAKHEVKTTRITKTINSGSSSTPVTYTTCAIEEIWDEEILKELLEQARTYEERRKIRSRLRELMADREETKQSRIGAETAKAKSAANVPAEEESSASEYEEIIEEVTDYSEAESDVDNNEQTDKVVVTVEKSQKDPEQTSKAAVVTKTEEKSVTSVTVKSEVSNSKPETHTEQTVVETTTETPTGTIVTKTVEKVVKETSSSKDGDTIDSSEKGESLKPMVHDKQKTPQTMSLEGNSSSHSNQSTNSQKLKAAQTISNSKTAGSESSSMHAPYSKNNNNINRKTQKTASTAPTSSQNPIVTVQTAGRADSTSISNKTNNKNNSSHQKHSNSNSNININGNNDSSSSLGGSSVAVGSGDSPRQVDRLGVPQKEDSGTESGEDLRLIAAGLRDQLQIQSDSNIIEEVTGALSRLENSLNEGKDISVDTEKRKALLALVARLRAGLTSPEKLAEIAAAMSELDGNAGLYGETSSPEADAHRSNRSRFAKRKNRANRHTVGVSREELADARRYMEDMLIMGSISQSTTPEANAVYNNTPPQWYPLEKNASSGAILTQSSTPVLQRPKQFVPTEADANMTYTDRLKANNGKRRPLSGEYSVSFENPTMFRQPEERKESPQVVKKSSSPEDSSKFSRFTNKKHLMKRANTIDLAKTHKYNSEFDTDSDAEDKGPHLGLKRAVQVSVKKRVQNVVPPFEPKTENDRKFLAFINKQSDKPGLGWTSSRSVSNWTNKFGSIKNTFEGGLTGKPPQAPQHAKTQQSSKLFNPPMVNNTAPNPAANYITNQQIALRLQQEAERQAEERRRKFDRERLEFERRERDKLERQRQQRERQERERLEREHFERQRREQDQIAAAQHASILREQEKLAVAQQAAASVNVPKPIPINEFKHAPQSVFRPIDNVDSPSKPIYKPIAQLPRNSSNWRSLNTGSPRGQGNSLTATSPSQYGNTKPDNSFITSPPPSSRSPIALPWASKPTVDSSGFKSKANRFEERSKYDNISNAGPFIQRHNSLRSSNVTNHQLFEDFRKRPSLPNTCDPYNVRQMTLQQDPLAHLPPPQNISFTYSNLKPKTTYQSYPCLPSAVVNNSSDYEYHRSREDSLTDPHAEPLVLTSSNPLYCPTTPQTPPQLQQNQPQQLRLPRQFDLASPADSTPTSPSIYTMPQTDCTDDDLDSDNNLLEYHAVSRVMRKPQSQTAVTVGRRTGHVSDDELYGKNSRAAKNLLSTMKSIGNPNGLAKPKVSVTKRPEPITSPKQCLSPDGRSYQAPIVEPLFPEINKFEANRQPTYNDETKTQTTAPTYSQPAPRKQLGMYKSMENLNRSTFKNQSNFKATTIQQPSPKPYVSETQASYVVTYPIEDTTDDEDFSRLAQNKIMPLKSLELRKQRNVSENSTSSSTTASMSYSQNLPSPNTSWTSNPIVVDESSKYQNMPIPYQNLNKNLPTSPAEPTYQALSSQVVTSYSSVNQNQNYIPPPADYIKAATQYETPPQRTMPAQQQIPTQYEPASQKPLPVQQQMVEQFEAPAQRSMPTQQQMAAQYDTPPQRQMLSMPAQQQAPIATQPTTKSSYEAKSQRQLQQMQTTTNQKQTSTKSYGAQTQQQAPERTQKPLVTQKPTDYPKQSSKATTKTATSTTTTQEKRSLVSLRKTVSEDHHSGQRDQPVINPQNSNISQEMLTRLEQQRERVSNDIRRKSLGNAIDYQMEKQARFETQNSQEYKSSAPENTPDIVKSSLPKDESQPILKKFGPPQRHHYMPNSYQSPSANTTSTSVVSTSTHSKKMQGKGVHTTTNHTVVQTSQQIFNNTRPTVMETPATPQPDDDYIPRNIVFNNIHAFTSMNRHQEHESYTAAQEQHQATRPNKLSKSDSWNQIMMLQNQHQPTHTTKFNQSPANELRRTKSGHTLALPKMYEAAMTKTDISEKQKTVAAYFSGQKSPTQQETVVEQETIKRSVINRTKTSEKVSAASRKSLGSNLPIAPGCLQRSATMPHIANLNLLDESNVEDAFEQLIMEQKQQKSSTSTTEKTETKDKDGAVVTTTTKVTTRTVSGSAGKAASPFAKFKQLDKQNSQQSAKSPTTPTTASTPSSGNQPIFRFTDPALNAKAATVKEQLLQWCQSKTQEYENIEITNFSTSWNNGLAFCALIHHFLPDAFDYSQLTPKNRRKNFELAFTVADEKAGIAPLLDVEDMVVMQRPDWKCVFVYVQSIYRRFRNCQ